MGYNYSETLTVNGTQNLLALLVAAGYNGPAIVGKEASLLNQSTTVIAYLHLTDSGSYAPGTKQATSTPVVGTITGAGNATFTITAAGLAGSPLAVSVPVTLGMTPNQVAAQAVNSLNSNAAIAAFFDVSLDYGAAKAILTAKVPAANDGTMNIAYTNGTCTGLTPDATSDVVTAGALFTTTGMPFETGSATVPSASIVLPRGTDLSTTWLYTPSSIPIIAEVIG